MKVRITKCGKEGYWYSSRIGECFEVGEYSSLDYETLEGGLIAKIDCALIPEYGVTLIAEQPNDFDTPFNTQALSPQEEPNDKLFQAAVAAMQGMLANEGIRQIFCGNNGLHAIDIMPYAWDYAETLINEGKKRGHL